MFSFMKIKLKQMINVGISEGFHDAAITVLNDREIISAWHTERFSKIKNDPILDEELIPKRYDTISFYEKPFLKNTRRLFAGQNWQNPRRKYDNYFGHHQTHAAAGYYTAPFDDCNILVIDAIGEWNTITIWECKDNEMKKIK